MMLSKTRNNFSILKALIHRDIIVLFHRWSDNVIDSGVIVGFWYLMYGCLLPSMGMDKNLVTPIFFGIIITVLINVTYDRATADAFDLDFVRYIDYQIALPLPLNWLLAKYLISYTIDLFASSLPVIIFGRIIFGSMLQISQGNIILFFTMYIISIMAISLMMLVVVMAKTFWWLRDDCWPRVLLPLTLFGALYYPWVAVYDVMPTIGALYLLNPLIYMLEAMRSAATYNPIYLSITSCLVILCCIIMVLGMLLKVSVKKRLDPLV